MTLFDKFTKIVNNVVQTDTITKEWRKNMNLVELYIQQQQKRDATPMTPNYNAKMEKFCSEFCDFDQYGCAQLGSTDYSINPGIRDINFQLRLIFTSENHDVYKLLKDFENRLRAVVEKINTMRVIFESNSLGVTIVLAVNPHLDFFSSVY